MMAVEQKHVNTNAYFFFDYWYFFGTSFCAALETFRESQNSQ